MYQYILFDLDGTLTDSKEGIINCFKYAIEKLGDPIPSEETLLSFIGPPLRHSFGSLGYDEEKVELAIKTYRERYVPIGKYENKPVDGGVELCKRLRERGYRLAIASSKPRHMCVTLEPFVRLIVAVASSPLTVSLAGRPPMLKPFLTVRLLLSRVIVPLLIR